MRPIFALAILLLGFNSTSPDPKDHGSLLGAGARTVASAPLEETASASGKSDRAIVAAIPPAEAADAGHDQNDAAAEPQSPVPASTSVDGTADAADSLHGLCNTLLTSAKENDLPIPFFANLIWRESRLQKDAVSPVGALGIAQFMPHVAVEVGLENPFDPRQAIPASARFLRKLRAHFRNLGLVAAAYDAGAHRVSEWLHHRRALPRETRAYVVRVTGRSVEEWRKTPPDDSVLTFVRLLPCRELPVFADLEHAQLQQAQQLQQPQARPRHRAQAGVPSAPAAHRAVAARKYARRRAGRTALRTVIRSAHGRRRAASHHQHSPQKKRRVAYAHRSHPSFAGIS